MDIQFDGNYKYYKCRSLLACDTGGTVYESYKEFDGSGINANFSQYKYPKQNESCQTENIVYIIDREGKPINDQKTQNNLTTHIDDDKFNNYGMHPNVKYEVENEIIRYVTQQDNIQYLIPRNPEYTQNKELFFSTKNNGETEQDLNNQIFKNDMSITENSELYKDLYNLSNTINFKDVNENIVKDNLLLDKIICDENENNLQHLLNTSATNSELSDINNLIKEEINEDKYNLSVNSKVISKKHTNKRKQIYNIKNDSCPELIHEDNNIISNKIIHKIKNKKIKSRYNKENQRNELQQLKRNPFENLKMNSILKGNNKLTLQNNKNQYILQKTESISSNDENFESSNYTSNDENFEPSSYTSNDENFEPSSYTSNDENLEPSSCNSNDEYCEQTYSYSNDENFESSTVNSNDEDELIYRPKDYESDYLTSFHSEHDVFQEIDAIITLNSEFTNADYLEYVQPRERIIESDMDKLLSPTIEFSEILKTCKITHMKKDKQDQIDCNGNQLNFHDIHQMNNNKSMLSENEIAEKELFLKSKYAKKLGYENYFNTSNESIVNEILFEPSITDENVKQNLNVLKPIEMYSQQNSFFDNSFNSVSCSLLESINEFNQFGGFLHNIYKKEDLNNVENSDLLIKSEFANLTEANTFPKENNFNLVHDLKEKDHNEMNTNFTFNFSNKSNLLSLDFQSRYNSLEYYNNVTKPTSNSLKMKIKRINDENNEYVIDDSLGHFININNNQMISKSGNDIYRYKCFYCSAKFRTKRILKNHVSEIHKGPYDTECEICHMKFKKSSAHKKHQPWCQKNVTHKCDICTKVYCYRASLIKHLKTHKKLIY